MDNPYEQFIPKPNPYEQFVENDPAVDFDVGTMVRNIPGSGKRLATETWKGIKATPDLVHAVVNDPAILKEIPGAVWDELASRYGSVDKFQQTLMDDPVGVFADMAGLLSGGGFLAKAGAKGVMKGAEGLYSSVAKFSTTLSPDEKSALVKMALERGVGPTPKGASKLSGRIAKLNGDIDELIAAASPSQLIPVDDVFRLLKETRHDLGGMRNLDAADDLAKINGIENQFREYAASLGRDAFSVEELQSFKKNVYNTVKFNATKQKGTLAEEKARKAIGRAAKEEMETAVPGIAKANRELSDLYELQPYIERSASRIANRHAIGLPAAMVGGPAGLGFGLGAGMGPATGLSTLLGVVAASAIMNPTVGQGAARLMHWAGRGADKIPYGYTAGVAAPYAFTMPGRIDDEDE